MNKKLITISILALAFIGGFLVFYNPKPSSAPSQNNPATSGTEQKWETKTDEQANVTVVVTPLDLSPRSSQWKFDIGMNTHSVELDQDMTKSVVLVDDQNKEYAPVTWDGPAGGHHREGVLTFNAITPTPKSINLKISDIGGVIRNFSWQPK
jgi:hypothetical protein